MKYFHGKYHIYFHGSKNTSMQVNNLPMEVMKSIEASGRIGSRWTLAGDNGSFHRTWL